VAVGDVTGDGIQDVITGAGPGGGPQVRVFDGSNNYLPVAGILGSFFGITPTSFSGGVFVAVGDVNGDTYADIMVGADASGGPQVNVFSGLDGSILKTFNALPAEFTGGVRVGAGDLDGDGLADIIIGAGPGALPQVTVYRFADLAVLQSFFAFPLNFSGGVYVAGGDLNNDGFADVVAGAGRGGGPQVTVLNGQTGVLSSFFAYNPLSPDVIAVNPIGKDGVRVGVTAVNGKGAILTGPGPGAESLIHLFDGTSFAQLTEFFAFDLAFKGGVFVGG